MRRFQENEGEEISSYFLGFFLKLAVLLLFPDVQLSRSDDKSSVALRH